MVSENLKCIVINWVVERVVGEMEVVNDYKYGGNLVDGVVKEKSWNFVLYCC